MIHQVGRWSEREGRKLQINGQLRQLHKIKMFNSLIVQLDQVLLWVPKEGRREGGRERGREGGREGGTRERKRKEGGGEESL